VPASLGFSGPRQAAFCVRK